MGPSLTQLGINNDLRIMACPKFTILNPYKKHFNANSVFQCMKMARIHNMESFALKLIFLYFFEKVGILTKIVKNLNFAIWKNVVLNFVGPPR